MTTTIALPSPDVLAAAVEAGHQAYRAAQNRIARLRLIELLVVTRQAYPGAAAIGVTVTDQDYSGYLESTGVVFAADGSILGTDGSFAEVVSALMDLDDRVEGVWGEFSQQSGVGETVGLDLDAIEVAAARLLDGLAVVETASDTLYAVNDALTALLGQYGSPRRFEDEDACDAALNSATLTVASLLRLR